VRANRSRNFRHGCRLSPFVDSLRPEGAGADSIGRRKFCMLKCRIDTACREPASAHPIPPRRSTCFRERDLHNSKEIIFRAARLAGSSRSQARARARRSSTIYVKTHGHSFPEHQTGLRGGATYSPGKSRSRILVKRSASGWGMGRGGGGGGVVYDRKDSRFSETRRGARHQYAPCRACIMSPRAGDPSRYRLIILVSTIESTA